MHLKKIKDAYHKFIIRLPLEAMVWILGLMLLALYDPFQQEHMTLCFFNNLGFTYCPGCGLGRSVSFLMHGHVMKSLEAHFLGIPAVIMLTFRIFQLFFISQLAILMKSLILTQWAKLSKLDYYWYFQVILF